MNTESKALATALITLTPKQENNMQVVRTICNRIRDDVLAQIPHMPEAWDGHELRLYLSDKFAYEVTNSMKGKNNYRRNAYRNTIKMAMWC